MEEPNAFHLYVVLNVLINMWSEKETLLLNLSALYILTNL